MRLALRSESEVRVRFSYMDLKKYESGLVDGAPSSVARAGGILVDVAGLSGCAGPGWRKKDDAYICAADDGCARSW